MVIRLGQPILLSELRVAAGVGDECPHTALPTKLTVWDEERGSLLTTRHYRKDGSLRSQSGIMPSELPLQLVKEGVSTCACRSTCFFLNLFKPKRQLIL